MKTRNLKVAKPVKTRTPAAAQAQLTKTRARGLRFMPDPGTLAEIGVHLGGGRNATVFGLVLNESSTGCAVVLATKEALREGQACVCRIGRLPECEAELRWVKVLEPGLVKLGIQYLLP